MERRSYSFIVTVGLVWITLGFSLIYYFFAFLARSDVSVLILQENPEVPFSSQDGKGIIHLTIHTGQYFEINLNFLENAKSRQLKVVEKTTGQTVSWIQFDQTKPSISGDTSGVVPKMHHIWLRSATDKETLIDFAINVVKEKHRLSRYRRSFHYSFNCPTEQPVTEATLIINADFYSLSVSSRTDIKLKLAAYAGVTSGNVTVSKGQGVLFTTELYQAKVRYFAHC